MSSFSQKRGPLRWILIQVGTHPVQQDYMLNRGVAQWWTKATGFSFTFQDINHGLMLLSLSVHASRFFPFVQSLVVRLALYSIISLCIVFIIPQEGGILWYNWVRAYCLSLFSPQTRLPHSEWPFCSEKGDTLELKDATKRVYIKEFVIEVFWGGFVVEKKKKKPFLCILGLNVALFFISVFMLADFDWGYNVRHFLLFPAFVFVSCSSYISLLLCLPSMTLLYSQMLSLV